MSAETAGAAGSTRVRAPTRAPMPQCQELLTHDLAESQGQVRISSRITGGVAMAHDARARGRRVEVWSAKWRLGSVHPGRHLYCVLRWVSWCSTCNCFLCDDPLFYQRHAIHLEAIQIHARGGLPPGCLDLAIPVGDVVTTRDNNFFQRLTTGHSARSALQYRGCHHVRQDVVNLQANAVLPTRLRTGG